MLLCGISARCALVSFPLFIGLLLGDLIRTTSVLLEGYHDLGRLGSLRKETLGISAAKHRHPLHIHTQTTIHDSTSHARPRAHAAIYEPRKSLTPAIIAYRIASHRIASRYHTTHHTPTQDTHNVLPPTNPPARPNRLRRPHRPPPLDHIFLCFIRLLPRLRLHRLVAALGPLEHMQLAAARAAA